MVVIGIINYQSTDTALDNSDTKVLYIYKWAEAMSIYDPGFLLRGNNSRPGTRLYMIQVFFYEETILDQVRYKLTKRCHYAILEINKLTKRC